MMHRNIIQLILFCLFPFFLQSQTYPFTTYSVKDGLSQSSVSSIVQDKNGYIWLGSESGTSKFDGKNFKNYTIEDGLADNNVACILKDKKGNLWLAHENGLLTKYNGVNFLPIICESLPKDKKIFSLYQDKDDRIWVCSAGGAIEILNPEGNLNDKTNYKVYTSKEGLSQYILAVRQDKNGALWFLTDVGIKKMNSETRKFEFFNPPGMPFSQITSFIFSGDDLVFGTVSGIIYKFLWKNKTIEPVFDYRNYATSTGGAVTTNFVYTIFEDSKNNLWASVFNIGLCRIDLLHKGTIVFNTSNGLAVNKIKSIAEDNEGNILIGTLGEGLQIYKGERFVSFSKANGLINSQVWAISKDNEGSYWFGTNEGLTVYNPDQTSAEKKYRNISVIDGSPSNNVRSIVKDKKGNLWIGTWGGRVIKYSSEKFVSQPQLFEYVNPFVSCLLVDSKNKLWIGSIDGLTVYDLNSEAIKSIRTINGLSDNDITCLFEDSRGKIWVGTKQKGITTINGAEFKKLGKDEGLTYTGITSIAEDKNGKIWIGTEGGGAFVYENSKFSKYKVSDGLLSDFITLVTVDDKNNIWLGTNKGLCKFDQSKKQFLSYKENDGFTGIETKPKAVYTDDEKNIWFGTVNGVIKYNPIYDNSIDTEPILHITSLKINQKEYPLKEKLELSYKENSLYLEFIGISLSNPDEITYKFKLENYDENWRPATKQNLASYSNLSPGNYIFKLLACNNKGICSQQPVYIEFSISPPFWKTWWFYALVFLIGSAIVLSYVKIRERALVQENRILEEKVQERTAEVVQKNIELDEKNKDITASIRYAKRIQDAILPPDEFVKKYLPKTFILFKPKDIVSGDFYWLDDKKDQILFAAVDCTGHGVPGAFMSIVGHNKLDQIVAEQGLTKPSDILNELNKNVSYTLRQSYIEDNQVKDGMDIALCSFNRKTNVMEYAGAYNPMWLIRKGEITEFKADKFPIGNLKAGEVKKFTNHSIPLEVGDTIYIFSDGFADQFGGPDGKKLKYSTFKKLLLDSQHLSMEEQGAFLNKIIDEWRGKLEQVDDILVIGTRL